MLDTIDHVASIGTAALAAWAYAQYRWEKGRIRREIEAYLKEEKAMLGDRGRRSITHLVVALGVPANMILEAAFASSHIERHATTNPQNGLAGDIMLEFKS